MIATNLTRLLLRLYPPSFRREVGGSLVTDVARRAAEHAAQRSRLRHALWLLRLTASLLLNAPAAWIEARGKGRSGFSWIDVKLGLRMLRKHPGMTLAGGLGIAVAIGVSAGFFSFMYTMLYPDIPLDEGDRLVGLENWDLERNNEERRSLHDFVVWREEMRSVEDMSAFRTVRRNLVTGDGPAELVRIAEMTPSGFALARVPPLMGRTLVPADAEPGAPDVLVIGYDVWRTRFAGDPEIVGKDVRLGRVVHTIVGVMPEGFAFPESHSYWIPFREDPADHARGEGPSIYISGRLARGYTLADAKAELAVIGQRMAAEFPDTHARYRAQVMPYVYPLIDINQNAGEDMFGEFVAINSFIGLLLVLVGLNVAVLVYARTATRRGEIAVRTALGASRRRVVGQLFVESLVLAVGAALVGLGLAKVGLHFGNEIMAMEMAEMPFWLELGIPGPALAWIGLLTVLTAVLTGVVPGLQATSQRVQENLRQYHSGVGLRLGRTWTTLIVVQVAIAVAGLPVAVAAGWWEIARGHTAPTYAVDRYLAVSMIIDEEGLGEEEIEAEREARAAHLETVRSEVVRRLEAEPFVVGQTRIVDLPRGGQRRRAVVERASGSLQTDDPVDVRQTRAHPDFFPRFDVELVAGRALVPGDLDEGAADVIVVDRTFVERALPGSPGGGEVVGRRVRFVTEEDEALETRGTERWYEIVGVIEPLHSNWMGEDLLDPYVYVPASAAASGGAGVVLEVAAGVEPASLTDRVREIAAELDPTLRLQTLPLTVNYRQQELATALVGLMLVLIVAAVLLLSAAGIYALMSFTVSQRRREIGIRTALGAHKGRLLGGIFGRALAQLGAGVALGLALVLLVDWQSGGETLQGQGWVLLPVMVVVMTGVGLLAAMGPARSGMGVAVAEVLGSE